MTPCVLNDCFWYPPPSKKQKPQTGLSRSHIRFATDVIQGTQVNFLVWTLQQAVGTPEGKWSRKLSILGIILHANKQFDLLEEECDSSAICLFFAFSNNAFPTS